MMLRSKLSKRYLSLFLSLLIVFTSLFAYSAFPMVASAATQAAYYVSPTGNDSNDGSINAPFQTITKARDVVRTINKNMTGDIYVYLRGGDYRITSTITFGPEDSGTNGYRIYYKAYSGETPVINGATKVTGWQQDTVNTNLYKATLDRTTKLRNLYVNDKRASMTLKTVSAKGSEGTYTVTKWTGTQPSDTSINTGTWAWASGSKSDGVKYLKTDLPAIAGNQDDLEIINGSTWNENIVCVRDVITSATDSNYWVLRLQQPYGSIAQLPGWGTSFSTSSGASHKIYNAYEFFSGAGQFYFNKTTKTLYYWPRSGEDMTTADVEAPVLDKLIDIAGTSTTNRVKNISFEGITFENTDWQLFDVAGSHGKATVQGATGFIAYGNGDWHASKYEILETNPGMINVCSSDSVDFTGNVIKHSGADGLSMINDVVNSNVTGNYIYDIASSGITVGHPQHVYIGDKGTNALEKYDVGVEGICKDDNITNNMMYDISTCPGFGGCAGVTAFFVDGLKITYNTIHTTAYNGINLGWGWQNFLDSTTCRNNVVSYNRLYNTLNRLHDSGAIYTLGQMPNTFINENYVKGIPNNSAGPTYGLHNDEGSAYITENDNVLDIDPGVTYTINCEDYGKKHDLTILRTYATVNKMGKNPPTSTIDTPIEVSDNSWPQAQYNNVLKAGMQEGYRNLLPASLFPVADYVFPAGCSVPVTGAPVQLNIRSSGDANNAVWFAPAGTTTFAEGPTMTKASGTATSIAVPSQGGKYKLFVVNSQGTVVGVSSSELKATLPTPELAELNINGSPLAGFSANTLSYAVTLPKGTTSIPVVTATAKAGTGTVSIVNTTTMPGITAVTVSNAVESKVYNISFGYAPTSSSFMNGTIDSDWNILNPDPANYSVVNGSGLRLPTQNSDIYSTARTWKNVFLRPAGGDWDIVSTAYFPVAPSANYQQQAFLVWQDEDNYIKLDIENSSTTAVKIQFGYEKAASFKSVATNTYAVAAGSPLKLYLRIKKTGDSYTGYYSKDGINYTTLGTTSLALSNTQIGVFATKNSSNAVIDTFCQGITVLSSSNPLGTVAPVWSQGSAITASAQTTNSLTLSWNAAQDDKAVTSYRIYNGSSILATVPGNTLSYDVSGLTQNTSYTFKVEAGDGDDAWSSSGPSCTTATLDTPDVSVPAWPLGSVLTPSAIFANNVTLTWPAAQDDKAVTGYNIYNGSTLIATVTETKYEVAGLEPNTDYTFKVEAGDKAGKWSTDGPSVTTKTTASYKYEAEKATLSGGAAIATDHTGYLGTGFVGGLYNTANSKVSFSVNAPTDGNYTLALSYSNGGSASSTNVGLYVNGTKIKNITCTSTSASWNAWLNENETVTLNSGVNTIEYKTETASTNCINVDYLAVTWAAAATAPTWPQNTSFTTQDVTTTGITLSWSAAQDDKAVTSYKLYNGKNLIATVTASAVNISEVTDLTPDTAYTFRVEAGDEDGNWSGGPSLTVKTKELPDTTAPTWPQASSITPSNIASKGLTLAWTAAQDNKAVTSYRIYNGADIIATVAADINSYEVTGLTLKTSYTFKVEAGDAAGNWSTDGPSKIVSTPDTLDTVAPTWPKDSTLDTSDIYGNGLRLTWQPASDNVAVSKYKVYKGKDLLATVSASTENKYDVTGLLPGTAYTFKVIAGDPEGNWSTDGPSTTVKTNSKIKYEAEIATLSGGTTVASDHVGYSGSGFVSGTDKVGAKISFSVNVPSAEDYIVELKYSAGTGNKSENMALYVNNTKITNLSCNPTSGWNEWTDDIRTVTLNSGANTIDYIANSASTNCINLDYIFISMTPDTKAPTWPETSIVTAPAIGLKAATLNWTPAEDNRAVAGYDIYNGAVKVASVSESVNTYDVTGLTAGTVYTFKVEARDQEGNASTNGPTATLTTKQISDGGDVQAPTWPADSSITASDITTNSVTLTWPAAQDDTAVTGYAVYKGEELLGTVAGNITSYVVSGLTAGTEYTFTIKAKDASLNWNLAGIKATVSTLSDSGEPKDTTAPAWNNATLSASDISKNALTLTWTAAQDDTAVTGYKLYKGSDIIATIAGDVTHYNVSGLTSDTAYTFKVEAGDAAGNWSANGPSKLVATLGGGKYIPPTTTPVTTTPVTTPTDNTEVKDGVINAQPKVTNGVASTEVTKDMLDKALGASSAAKIVVSAAAGAKEYVQTLPVSSLQSSDSSKKITIETPVGTAVVPVNALKAENIQQKTVDISLAVSDSTALSQSLKNQIGNRPVVDVDIKAGGNSLSISNPLAPVAVSLDYKPTAEELKKSEHIVVWSIGSNGEATPVTSGKYDAETGKVTFNATEPGTYAVTYVEKKFEDTYKTKWAEDKIEVLASKGIVGGTSETTFSPQNSITRAEYLTLLMKSLGLKSNETEAFDDVKPGDYYFNAVATAKMLGITNGTGDNKFNPSQLISRQDMIVLTEKALEIAKEIAKNGSSKDLEKFSDKSDIAGYAVDSVANFVNSGLISGSNGSINPRNNATRAEAAVIIYKIYNK